MTANCFTRSLLFQRCLEALRDKARWCNKKLTDRTWDHVLHRAQLPSAPCIPEHITYITVYADMYGTVALFACLLMGGLYEQAPKRQSPQQSQPDKQAATSKEQQEMQNPLLRGQL